MKAIDFGFTTSSCFTCKHSKEEAFELTDGKPQCLIKGHCKHFNQLTERTIEYEGLTGNPSFFLSGGGLELFEVLSTKLQMLSGLDGYNLQTFDFYGNLAGTSDIPEEMFQSLLAIKLSYIRNRQIDEKIKASHRR